MASSAGLQLVCSWWDWWDPQWPHPNHEAWISPPTSFQREPPRVLHEQGKAEPACCAVLLTSGREVPESRPEVPRPHLRMHHGLVQPLAQRRPYSRSAPAAPTLNHPCWLLPPYKPILTFYWAVVWFIESASGFLEFLQLGKQPS